MTTSKKIIIASYVIAVVLTAFIIVGTVLSYDVSTLGMIAGAAYAEVGVSNGFYYNKAKKENAMKIAIGYVKDNPDKAEELAAVINAIGGIV